MDPLPPLVKDTHRAFGPYRIPDFPLTGFGNPSRMNAQHHYDVVVAIGSNLGDRLEYLEYALSGLAEGGLQLEAVSSVFETPPIGYLDQPPFLNMVVVGRTDLGVRDLFSLMNSLEAGAGRARKFSNAPRTLDLDLVFFDGRILREDGLQLPHPRWKERSFVVQPLAEIAPNLRDPETGWRISEVAQLWPLNPAEIQIVKGSEGFLNALEGG